MNFKSEVQGRVCLPVPEAMLRSTRPRLRASAHKPDLGPGPLDGAPPISMLAKGSAAAGGAGVADWKSEKLDPNMSGAEGGGGAGVEWKALNDPPYWDWRGGGAAANDPKGSAGVVWGGAGQVAVGQVLMSRTGSKVEVWVTIASSAGGGGGNADAPNGSAKAATFGRRAAWKLAKGSDATGADWKVEKGSAV